MVVISRRGDGGRWKPVMRLPDGADAGNAFTPSLVEQICDEQQWPSADVQITHEPGEPPKGWKP